MIRVITASKYSELIKFSFIKTRFRWKIFYSPVNEKKPSSVHHDPTDRKEVHKFLLTYYSNKIEEIDIKAITPEHETALIEAFYHAKEALEAEEFAQWFISVSDPFNRAAFWQLITPMYEEMLQILEAELGPEHPSVATTLNNLAGLYRQMGDYEKALPLYQRALEIREKVLGPQHPVCCNNTKQSRRTLSSVWEITKKHSHFIKGHLTFSEKVLGPQHPDVATTLNNLAALYRQYGRLRKSTSTLSKGT